MEMYLLPVWLFHGKLRSILDSGTERSLSPSPHSPMSVNLWSLERPYVYAGSVSRRIGPHILVVPLPIFLEKGGRETDRKEKKEKIRPKKVSWGGIESQDDDDERIFEKGNLCRTDVTKERIFGREIR